jgi:anti-sigma factor RsiW
MHNCRLTRNALVDYALGEMPAAQTTELLAELKSCPSCQAEYSSVRNTLQVSERALRSALPTEDFWAGYHARLQSKLEQHLAAAEAASTGPAELSLPSRFVRGLGTFATTSIRVPAPAALALMLIAGVLLFSPRPQGETNVSPLPSTPSVETRTIQVPVIQEKVVTQIVYVDRKPRRNKSAAGSPNATSPNGRNNLASAGADASSKTAMSLVGFKPTNEVKLTVIKGSYQDEK